MGDMEHGSTQKNKNQLNNLQIGGWSKDLRPASNIKHVLWFNQDRRRNRIYSASQKLQREEGQNEEVIWWE